MIRSVPVAQRAGTLAACMLAMIAAPVTKYRLLLERVASMVATSHPLAALKPIRHGLRKFNKSQ